MWKRTFHLHKALPNWFDIAKSKPKRIAIFVFNTWSSTISMFQNLAASLTLDKTIWRNWLLKPKREKIGAFFNNTFLLYWWYISGYLIKILNILSVYYYIFIRYFSNIYISIPTNIFKFFKKDECFSNFLFNYVRPNFFKKFTGTKYKFINKCHIYL